MKQCIKDEIIQGALKAKLLIEVCSGCKYPINEDDLIYFPSMDLNKTHDCACDTSLVWNPKIEIKL